ncbi:hypothetical protein AYI69_g2443 [Smittium culicis]|uniref:Uncharacterized protein n=1 Tax=Smittium culicis TaxID=133412 RepID=A0A1R1YMI6_9FUNG|nr:hypothetical protein AYI69_g2443 [Smittium culicis]
MEFRTDPGFETSEDPEVNHASTMRALQSELDTKVAQKRLDKLHKGPKTPGKLTQISDTDIKPLIDQKALDALIAKKPAAKRQRVQQFFKHQQSSNNKD